MERPRITLDTSQCPTNGNIVHVGPNDNLQAAIDSAHQGDTLELDPAGVYTGTFAFKDKPENGQWLVLRSAAWQQLPEGRVSPADAHLMPKLQPPDNQHTLDIYPTHSPFLKAHHIRFIGLELHPNPSYPTNSGLVKSGSNGSWQTTPEVAPADIIYDRCYMHGLDGYACRRGIYINSARTAIVDSYFSDFKDEADAQALLVGNSPGGILIRNNYLESTGENFMSGGLDTKIVGLSPADITFIGNDCVKRLSWCAAHPSFDGHSWGIKNLFELKNATRVLVEGNSFENNWVASQAGTAIVIKSTNQDNAPWSTTCDVTLLNNVIKNVAGGISLLGREKLTTPLDLTARRISLIGNRIEGLAENGYLGDPGNIGRIFQLLGDLQDVTIERNVCVSSGAYAAVICDGTPTQRLRFANNILSRGQYGIKGSGTGEGNDTVSAYMPGSEISGNLFLGGAAQNYPAGNYYE